MKYDNLVFCGRLESDTISSIVEKSYIVEDVYSLLLQSYSNVKGGLHFANPIELISKTSQWRVIYLDNTIVGVIIYKAKKGLKMVAMGISNSLEYNLRKHIKSMLSSIFRLTFRNSWMEVSEGAERFILGIGGDRFIMPNSYASSLTGKDILKLDDDGLHYYREINGVIKRKLIIGTFKKQF